MKLAVHAISKFLIGIIFVSLLLFVPAGTIKYYNAWLFMVLLFLPMFIFGLILFIKNPKLLEKRLNNKEKENTQKIVVLLFLLLFISGFIVCGLDYKFGLSTVPEWLIIFSSILLLFSYGIYIEVMRENFYLSRTVEIQENQKIIDSGLYGIVRHPMYLAVIFLFLSMPLILGSWYAFLLFLIFPVLLIIRIFNEEKVLETSIPSYKKYKDKVKYRLIPFIW